jgi:hypothetical protein
MSSATAAAPTRSSRSSARSPPLNVRGNHDRVCCGLSLRAGLQPGSPRSRALDPASLRHNLEWLKELAQGQLVPETLAEQDPDVTCVHGSPLNEDQYILNMRDAWAPLQQMTAAHHLLRPHPCPGRLLREGMTGTRFARATARATRPEAGPSRSARHPPPHQSRLSRPAARLRLARRLRHLRLRRP